MRDFNGLVTELDKKYFPLVKYYHDSKETQKLHYVCELLNNGCTTLSKVVEKLSKITKEDKEVIKQIILKYYVLN